MDNLGKNDVLGYINHNPCTIIEYNVVSSIVAGIFSYLMANLATRVWRCWNVSKAIQEGYDASSPMHSFLFFSPSHLGFL